MWINGKSDFRPAAPILAYGDSGKAAAAVLYQIVGCLLSDTGQFDSTQGQKVLDLLGHMKRGEPIPFDPMELLPFPSIEDPRTESKREGVEL